MRYFKNRILVLGLCIWGGLAASTANASCSYTAPANGSLLCNWKPGLQTYKCAFNTGCYNDTHTTASPTSTVQSVAGRDCSSTDPAIYSTTMGASCFRGGTSVSTSSGEIEIQKIQVGQKVLSYDFETNTVQEGTVTQVMIHPKQNYWILDASDGLFLEVTPNHPIFDSNQNQFIRVDQMDQNSVLITRSENASLSNSKISRIYDFGLVDDVYNLEVVPYHNYFAKGILVHNKYSCGDSGAPSSCTKDCPGAPGPYPITTCDAPVSLQSTVADTLSSCSLQCNTDYSLVGTTCVYDPAPSSLTFSPGSGAYTVTGNAGGSPVLNLVASNNGDLGDVVQGQPSLTYLDITVQNNSPTTDASGCNFTFPSGSNFQVDPSVNNCVSVPRGQQCLAKKVIFGKPGNSSLGPLSDVLTFQCGTGSGTTLVKETSITLPAFSFNPTSASFPNTVSVGSQPNMTITVTNNGSVDAAMCVPSISPSQGFIIADKTCNQTIKPGVAHSCDFTLTANPQITDVGNNLSTQFSITCNGNGSNNYNLAPYVPYTSIPSAGPYSYTASSGCVKGQYKINGQCSCPSGYEVTSTSSDGGSACRPILPSLEFYKNSTQIQAGTNGSDGYPVCGEGRVPVTTGLSVLSLATGTLPQSSSSFLDQISGYSYLYSKTGTSPTEPLVSPNSPTYLYSSMNRCVCGVASDYTNPPIPPNDQGTTLSTSIGGQPRFARDDFSQISTQDRAGSVVYATVPIAADGVSNGYMGDVYSNGTALGATQCGCPNLNEHPSPINVLDGTPAGYYCKNSLNTSDSNTQKYSVLTPYNKSMSSQVFEGDPTVTTVTVPSDQSATSYKSYARKIWTCAPPMKLDPANKVCSPFAQNRSQHMCDNNSANPSVVSSKLSISTTSAVAAFNQTVNKKLACCLNAFNPSNLNADLKFDCVDNSSKITPGSSFDDLWKGSDDAQDGGQSYALLLSNASGQLVTGFYTLQGQRCSEFSEFAGTIKSARVNQAIVAGQQVQAGGAASLSTIDTTGSVTLATPVKDSYLKAWLANPLDHKAKTVPSTAADMRRCPILVRAAMVATCPPDQNNGEQAPPVAQNSYTDAGVTHCTAADSVKVHLRVEQIYEIAGMPKMKTIDSVLDSTQATTVTVGGLIQSKTAGTCPPGTSLKPDGNCEF